MMSLDAPRERQAPVAERAAQPVRQPRTASPVLRLQRSAGNAAIGRLLRGEHAGVERDGRDERAAVQAEERVNDMQDTVHGEVRVHTGIAAGQLACHLQARALTIGRDIVLAPGEYAPHSPDGRRLLAHELVHVAQQASDGRVRIQRKPKAAAKPPFYQEVLDDIAGEEKTVVTIVRSTFGGFALPFLRKMLRLSQAVEAADTGAIPALVADLTKERGSALAPYVRSETFANELISRTILLGLSSEAEKLRRWFREIESGYAVSRLKSYGPEHRLWDTTVENALAGVKLTSKAEALRSIDLLLTAYTAIRDEVIGLDAEAIKRDIESRRHYVDSPFYLGLSGESSIASYRSSLMDLLRQLVRPVQVAFQVLMDAAIADLEAGRGDVALGEAKDVLEKKIKPVMLKVVEGKYGPDFLVEITRSTFGKRSGKHLDVFLEGAAAKRRSVGFSYYDEAALYNEEKQALLVRILEIRTEQISFLERLYGLAKDKRGATTQEAKEHAAIIGAGAGVRLHSNDDWRGFLRAKFRAEVARGQSKGQALNDTVDFLQSYLHAFTTHSPFNIDDFGDNYLTKTFPRALTGQLIHDCGVYALRVAYMLSLLRTELGLRIRFIRLPVHLGLVITGKDLPVYIVHNGSINHIDPTQLDTLREQWRRRDEAGKEIATPRPVDESQFLAELAAGFFITHVDMPYRFEDLPQIARGDIKAQYWAFYQRRTVPDILAPDPTSGIEDFELQYLQLIESYKRLYNSTIVPFWNVSATDLWKQHGPNILTALATVQKARNPRDRAAAESAYQAAVKQYRTELSTKFAPSQQGLDELDKEKTRISELLIAHPKLLAKGAKIAHARRSPANAQWDLDLGQHLDALSTLTDLDDRNKAQNITPKFATAKGRIGFID